MIALFVDIVDSVAIRVTASKHTIIFHYFNFNLFHHHGMDKYVTFPHFYK